MNDGIAFRVRWRVVLPALVCLLAGILILVVRPIIWPPDQGILDRPLRVGLVQWPGYAGGIVANHGFKPSTTSLFWKNHRLLVQFVLEDEDNVERRLKRLASGDLDVIWSTVDSWAHEAPKLLEEGVRARAILQVDWSQGGDAIVADQNIKSLQALASADPPVTVALAMFTPSLWFLEYSLDHGGVSEKDRRKIIKNLLRTDGSPAAGKAYEGHLADAAVIWEPDVTHALQKRIGSHILLATTEANRLIADIMVAREDLIAAHPNAIKAFVQGWLNGTSEAYSYPNRAVGLLMDNEPSFKDIEASGTPSILGKVRWAGLIENTEMFGLDGQTSPRFDKLFQEASQVWAQFGYVTPVAPADAKDDKFLREVWIRTPVQPPPENKVMCSDDAPALMIEPMAIRFPMGQTDLNSEAMRLADRIAEEARKLGNACIWIDGNTDNVGDPAKNLELSRRRAHAVVDYLLANYHFDDSRIKARGNGEESPVCPANNTEACRQQNRRTDVRVSSTDR